ncbi:hypothetical protein Ctob_012787, partial [Chrysochromulina tobinii]
MELPRPRPRPLDRSSLRMEALDALNNLEELGQAAEEDLRHRKHQQERLRAERLERLGGLERPSEVMRNLGESLRHQFAGIKTSLRAGLTLFLVVSILLGLLQLAWHWINASVLSNISRALEIDAEMRAYWLVAPPMAWYVTMIVCFSLLLCQVRNLPEDALIKLLRQLLGLERRAGYGVDSGDLLADFQEIATSLQDGLDSYDRMQFQMETTVATLGKFASVGRRLAENITANRQAELNDAEQREQLVASVAEVMFELINQMRTEEPSPIGPVGDLFPPGSQESKKVAMVREVTRLVRELKQWSEGEPEAPTTAPGPAGGRRGGHLHAQAAPTTALGPASGGVGTGVVVGTGGRYLASGHADRPPAHGAHHGDHAHHKRSASTPAGIELTQLY